MKWEIEVSLFKNPVILKQMALALSPFGLLIFFLLLLKGPDSYYGLGLIGGLFALTGLFLLIFFRGVYQMEFLINEKGVFYRSSSSQRNKNKFINRLTMFLAVFLFNPTAFGTSLLAQSRKEKFMAWRDVKKADFRKKEKFIQLKSSLLDPMGVFCTEKNYDEVEAFIKEKLNLRKST